MIERKVIEELADSGDREGALAHLAQLEEGFYKQGVSENEIKLREIMHARRLLYSTDTPIRAILEHINLCTT
ncbi:MAG TPA: hypothetical protein VJB98_02620 [Candidatus Paceibacterota bacterium]